MARKLTRGTGPAWSRPDDQALAKVAKVEQVVQANPGTPGLRRLREGTGAPTRFAPAANNLAWIYSEHGGGKGMASWLRPRPKPRRRWHRKAPPSFPTARRPSTTSEWRTTRSGTKMRPGRPSISGVESPKKGATCSPQREWHPLVLVFPVPLLLSLLFRPTEASP